MELHAYDFPWQKEQATHTMNGKLIKSQSKGI